MLGEQKEMRGWEEEGTAQEWWVTVNVCAERYVSGIYQSTHATSWIYIQKNEQKLLIKNGAMYRRISKSSTGVYRLKYKGYKENIIMKPSLSTQNRQRKKIGMHKKDWRCGVSLESIMKTKVW